MSNQTVDVDGRAGDMGGRHNLYSMIHLIVDAVAIQHDANCISLDQFSYYHYDYHRQITDHRDADNNLTQILCGQILLGAMII